MAVAFDVAAALSGGLGGTSPATGSLTATAGDAVLVGFVLDNAGPTSSVTATYGGVSMTLLKSLNVNNDSNGMVYLFGLANVAGGAQTVSIAYPSGVSDIDTGGVIAFTGAATTTAAAFGTPVTNTGSTGSETITIATTSSNNMASCILGTGGSNVPTLTTSRYATGAGSSGDVGGSGGATQPSTGGNVTFTSNADATSTFGIIAVEVLPPSAGAAPVAISLAIPPGRRSPMAFRFATPAPQPASTAVPSTPVSSSDSGTGTDSQGPVGVIPDTGEGGTGTDGTGTVGVGSGDSGSGSDGGSLFVTSSDSGTGTDNGEQIEIPQADSGTGTDNGEQITAQLSSSDGGTGTDTTGTIGVASSDAALGADTSGPIGLSPSGDSGTGTDTGTVSADVASSDSGTGTDTGVTINAVAGSDSGTGTDDGERVSAQVQSGDSGTGADAGTVTALVAGSDSGTGTDSQGPVQAAVQSSESGTGTDSSLFVGVASTDAATGTDNGEQISAAVQSSDSAHGTDGQVLIVPSSDSGIGTDNGEQVIAFVSSGDTGTGTDGQSVFTGFVHVFDSDHGHVQEGDQEPAADTDSAVGTDSQQPVQVSASGEAESAQGTDSQSVFYAVQCVADSDSGRGSEGWYTFANFADIDAGQGTDSQVLIYQPADTDGGVGNDNEPYAIGIFPFPPPWLFIVPEGGYKLVWKPGTPEECEVRRFERLETWVVDYVKAIRESDSIHFPSDSDTASGSEGHRQTADVLQLAAGTGFDQEASGQAELVMMALPVHEPMQPA